MKYPYVAVSVLFYVIMIIVIAVSPTAVFGQEKKTYTAEEYKRALNNLDGRPYDTAYDANIDYYVRTWKDAMPQKRHGVLAVRNILTPGDPLNPSEPGAVLKYAKLFAHASVGVYERTQPVSLEGEQEVYYVYEGEGIIKTSKSEAALHPGIGVLVPEGIQFTIENTGSESLKMYLLVEPCPEDFKPNEDMLVVDENKQPWNTGNPHWVGLSKPMFNTSKGLATVTNIITVQFEPMTMFHPHSHSEGIEEVWAAVSGELHFLLDKHIRKQPPGTAYYICPDGETPHSNFNVSDERGKLLYFSRFPK